MKWKIPNAVRICPRCEDDVMDGEACPSCQRIRADARVMAIAAVHQGVQEVSVNPNPYYKSPQGQLWAETFFAEFHRQRLAVMNARLPVHQRGLQARTLASPSPRASCVNFARWVMAAGIVVGCIVWAVGR